MSVKRKPMDALSLLLPVGILGASTLLAASHAKAALGGPSTHDDVQTRAVAETLRSIREGASHEGVGATLDVSEDRRTLLAQWINFGGRPGGFGWRNGGWGNGGGWRNGGWGNGGGWHNWGNGGWHNWGNGGWHNFWHNW